MAEDLTALLLRDEEMEQRSGILLTSLLIAFEQDHMTVRGQLCASSGTLKANVALIVSAYDFDGRVVGTLTKLFDRNFFNEFEVFSMRIEVFTYPLSRVLIYPKLILPRPSYGRRR